MQDDSGAGRRETLEERLRLVFEEAPLGLLEFDEQGLIIDCNENLLRLAGHARNEMIGSNLLDQSFGPEAQEALRSALRSGVGHFEGEFCPARSCLVRVSFRVVRDVAGGFRSGVGVVEEVGERRRAERDAAQRDEQLRTLITAMPDIVCFKDGEGRWLEANDFDIDLFQLRGVDYRGKKDSELADYSPFYREAFLGCEGSDEKAWKAGVLDRGEETIPRPDGTSLVFDILKAPLFNPDGSRKALVVIGRDITERKRLEERFLQAQKMEAVGRLAGGIAHDFNNLLTVINGFAALAARKATDPTQQEFLREVLAAADRGANLTRQLLAFSRRQVVQTQVISLNELIVRMHGMLRRLIDESIQLVVEPGRIQDQVLIDPGQLEQVLLNLAVNARDAMRNGGVLTLTTSARRLDDTEAARNEVRVGDYLELAVSDTGVGMSDAVRAHIFEPFFTTKGKGEGTGLGLATVYGIVRQAGGMIEVETAPDHGTTFRVLLPRAVASGADAGEPEALPSRRAPGQQRVTLLVVEDDTTIRDLNTRVLLQGGFEVLAAGTGQEALALARSYEGRIDLLMTDMALPDLKGRELAESLLEKRPGMRVLFTSGHADQTAFSELQDGVGLLPKPFSPSELLLRVTALLEWAG